MIELAIVLTIALIAMGIAMPVMLNTINASRVRNQMSNVASLVQMCRSRAIQKNAAKQLYFTTSGSETVAYVDDPNATPPAVTSTTPQLQMPHYFQLVPPPTASPAPLDSTSMWGDGLGNTPDTSNDLCFNSRGMPCQCPTSPTAVCNTVVTSTGSAGYAFYFTLTSQPGGTRWAAVGVSPAGRIRTFFWNGSSWSN